MSLKSWWEYAKKGAAWEWGRRHYEWFSPFYWLRVAALALVGVAAAGVILEWWDPFKHLNYLLSESPPAPSSTSTVPESTPTVPNGTPRVWAAHVRNVDDVVNVYYGPFDTDEDRQPAYQLDNGDSIKILCLIRGRSIPRDTTLGRSSDIWHRLQDHTYLNDLYVEVIEGRPDYCY